MMFLRIRSAGESSLENWRAGLVRCCIIPSRPQLDGALMNAIESHIYRSAKLYGLETPDCTAIIKEYAARVSNVVAAGLSSAEAQREAHEVIEEWHQMRCMP